MEDNNKKTKRIESVNKRRGYLENEYYKKMEIISRVKAKDRENTSSIEFLLKEYALSHYKSLVLDTKKEEFKKEALEVFFYDFPLFYVDMIFGSDVTFEDNEFRILKNKNVKLCDKSFTIKFIMDAVFSTDYIKAYVEDSGYSEREIRNKINSMCYRYAVDSEYIDNIHSIDMSDDNGIEVLDI